MHDTFASWLENAAACPAVLACGVRADANSVAVKTTQAEIPEGRVIEVINGLADTARVLKQNHIACDWFCWSLRIGQVYCAIRPDETMAVLLAGFDPGAVPDLERVLGEFLHAEM